MTFNDYCCKITLNRDIAAYHNYLLVEILYFPEKKKAKEDNPKAWVPPGDATSACTSLGLRGHQGGALGVETGSSYG